MFTGLQTVVIQLYRKMEPQDNHNHSQTHKNTQNVIVSQQINRYRNALPEVSREDNHFFFKEVTRQMEGISYVTFGYRVGRVPFELHDLMAVVVNCIHYSCQLNLKIILDEDQLYVTSSMAVSTEEMHSLQYRVEQSHLNESLLKAQRIIAQFLHQLQTTKREDDGVILQKVKSQLVKQLYIVFKNPDQED